jgi:hypothetical protein
VTPRIDEASRRYAALVEPATWLLGFLGLAILVFILALALARGGDESESPLIASRSGEGASSPSELVECEDDRPPVLLDAGVDGPDPCATTTQPAVAATEPPAASGPPGGPGTETCNPRAYRGRITGSVEGFDTGFPDDVAVTRTPVLSRADFTVGEDCRVALEVVWQVEYQSGLWVTADNPGGHYCIILILLGADTTASETDSEAGFHFNGRLSAHTGGISMACPGVDRPGNLASLLGGVVETGDVGSYLSQAYRPGEGGELRPLELSVSAGDTVHIEDLTVVTGYLTMTVDIDAAAE